MRGSLPLKENDILQIQVNADNPIEGSGEFTRQGWGALGR